MYEHGFKNNKEYFCLSASAVVAVRTYVYVIIHFFTTTPCSFSSKNSFVRRQSSYLRNLPKKLYDFYFEIEYI